jgi:hypothetical protein
VHDQCRGRGSFCGYRCRLRLRETNVQGKWRAGSANRPRSRCIGVRGELADGSSPRTETKPVGVVGSEHCSMPQQLEQSNSNNAYTVLQTVRRCAMLLHRNEYASCSGNVDEEVEINTQRGSNEAGSLDGEDVSFDASMPCVDPDNPSEGLARITRMSGSQSPARGPVRTCFEKRWSALRRRDDADGAGEL